MTIGDVLATVMGILAACASLWSALMVALLLFSTRTNQTAARIEARPWHCFRDGVLAATLAGLVTLLLLNQPSGFFKLIGWFSLALLLALTAFGSAGLSRVVANRILTADPTVQPIRAAGYGSGLLVATGLLPVLGWLIFTVSVLTGLGAAAQTFLKKTTKASAAATVAIADPVPATLPTATEYAHE